MNPRIKLALFVALLLVATGVSYAVNGVVGVALTFLGAVGGWLSADKAVKSRVLRWVCRWIVRPIHGTHWWGDPPDCRYFAQCRICGALDGYN
jgi:hypothetical protein